ncbi:hypothetical protein AB733_04830 [Photobacterium swingsii]|uniref:Uncharacterized protein n=1 Tax=Photobacterium swingsii TaxID=680026 RepID=A0A0J8VD89_9GAMM|nr:hypothetical protein [Photobacterium swingsii]KMV31453.1 hypothetical protein AB733_04830 [Photobacterium swingsii]PSW25031.1 hypothetical protein C9I94_09505 [Photobacterium swingsii]
MKKTYASPNCILGTQLKTMAAPLAIFSAATAAAAAVGLVAGAAATSKLIGDDINRCTIRKLKKIEGFI